ncbi:GNAT family N-acetyltransferase [Occallatibacter savannae]|uniref:GNAT family N-acetyltransferase n=1 Tax=Occallatibacter savannae TaxID=1002691 RepID=UPI000D68BBE6|nr:GNAT family N-acetyltransferase [Occallatibacter savannae]
MSSDSEILIRQATPADAPACSKICYNAFSAINAAHNFPCDFPNAEYADRLIQGMFNAPGVYSVVAESIGKILGSNCLDERAIVHGVGPITVDPNTQNRGVGRRLMQAVMDRSRERNAAGIRLVQAAFNSRSLSLYASLGFDVREPLAVMQGRTQQRSVPGCTVRPATSADLDACNALSHRIHGFDRGVDLAFSTQQGAALVVELAGRITGYSSALAFFGHTTAESNQDLQALLCSVDSYGGPGVIIPTRNAELFRWCLSNGLRVVEPLNLMSAGLYNNPAGAWLPSILF